MKAATLLALFLMFLGCTHTANMKKDTQPSENASKAEEVHSDEIVRLNQIVLDNPKSDNAKKAHLQLARLYLNHNNFRRNYHKAHNHMQAYVRLEKNSPDEETHNWIAVLREIDLLSEELDSRNQQMMQLQNELEKAEKQSGSIKRNNRELIQKEIELKGKNSRLEAANEKLRQTIEMLKRLDRRLEEKRRNLNN